MDLSLFEKSSLPIIQDFHVFIKYIEEEKPVLTAKKGVLGKKDSFKLNSKLNFKRDVTAPNYNQDQYLVIDLMFSLAVDSNLYVIGSNDKGKLSLMRTAKIESFLELNNFEKYVFLFETYWSEYDFDGKDLRWNNVLALSSIIQLIAKKNSGKLILKELNLQMSFSTVTIFFHHLSYFGLWDLELIEGVKSKYEASIKAIIPTELGILICKKLSTEALPFWNIEDVEIIMDHLSIKKKNKSLFFVLKSIFPDNLVEKTIKNEVEIDKSGVYIFKVSLSRGLWRKIKMSYKNTFEDLHNIIQKAYDFDNDHLYEFYIGRNRRTAKITYAGNPYEGIVNDIAIGEASLYKGQKIKYIFDFGDEWEFDITIVDIDKNGVLPIKPEIIESKGESPEQYAEW
ncbi:plasmid pRiA4b ORF-3 family protein [Clostridium sp.]|uniref:plasmid pRiA4b ORF-3 family protein n=1 Tax=Clostridium sp. TaxID=1506 RepID=UPI0035A12AB7